MNGEYKMSEQLDKEFINGVHLTLVSWRPNPEYPASYEIGWRHRGGFELIQFSMPSRKAWDIVKRLTAKGRLASQIRKVLERLER